jgi:hypothetical protein
MRWADVTATPTARILRQFAGILLVVAVATAGWRAWHGTLGPWGQALCGAGAALGGVGLLWPAAVRPVYTGWIFVAFPIGWTVSRLLLMAVFFLVFTPIGLVFRLAGRDPLRLRRPPRGSRWHDRGAPRDSESYLRQS